MFMRCCSARVAAVSDELAKVVVDLRLGEALDLHGSDPGELTSVVVGGGRKKLVQICGSDTRLLDHS
jgi:hypothetical protein